MGFLQQEILGDAYWQQLSAIGIAPAFFALPIILQMAVTRRLSKLPARSTPRPGHELWLTLRFSVDSYLPA